MARRPLPQRADPPIQRLARRATRAALGLLLIGAGLAGFWVVLG